VGRGSSGDEQHAVQIEGFAHLIGDEQMTEVNRVE
jgi:hypothetical protein